MVIPDPGDRAQGTDDNGDIGDRANYDNSVWIDRMVPKVVHDFKDKP
jgi:hypothetical protein